MRDNNKKTYIEFFYIQPGVPPILRYEISTRDPLQIEYDDITVAFRFCDKKGDEFINYSKWYFIGEELSLEDAIKRLGHIQAYKSKLETFKNNFVKRICITRLDNLVPMSDDDITIEQYKKENESIVKTKLNKNWL